MGNQTVAAKTQKTDGVAVKKTSLPLTDNSIKVLERRYLKKDADGNATESPEELLRRVARNIAQADKEYGDDAAVEKAEHKFYEMMTNLEFMPNSPTLMNAGRKLQQLSACFVLPVEDNMESIFQAVKDTAMVHKSGGGTGFSFTRLRPKNDMVSTTYGRSSGPVSFMHAFDATTDAVNQGGFRRGANMGVLNIDHPDIIDFITCKTDHSKLTNFNISVALTEKFMLAVERDEDYETVNPRSHNSVEKLKAREVFDLMCRKAWEGGDPGIMFLDRINADNPTPHIGRIESTNPCGEQPLLPNEACNLGSINLSKFVTGGKVDYDRLRETVHNAVHFLDNVINMSNFPLEQIKEMVHSNRKIGLGVMGWADLLVMLGVPYNSEQAIELAQELMGFITFEARKKSEDLAEKRGAFKNFPGSIFDRPGQKPVRNATATTIAPTGTISIISGCSSGIEPLFAVCYVRNVMDNDRLIEVNPYFEQMARDEGFYSDELIEEISRHGTIQEIDGIPDHVKELFVCAHDIAPEWHIRMQAAFQKNTDNAVSKTVNFPADATVEDVKHVYILAYKLGCKGVTIYRDSSREGQVLTKGDTVKGDNVAGAHPDVKAKSKKRSWSLIGKTIKMETGCGPLYITINEDEDGFFELFNTMGKAGGCAASQSEAIGRLVSLAWRSGISTEKIIKQLSGICCHRQTGLGANKIQSCSDAIARAIMLYSEESGAGVSSQPRENFLRGACPVCGGVVEHEGGCSVCKSCGHSDCS
jgi:ribonucleoside-diphosphate reductase alpha chain